MFARLNKLFAIKGYSLLVICVLLVGTGISISLPYVALYCTEKLGMSAAAFGIFTAVGSLSGVVANSFIGKHSDRWMDRRFIIILATVSSALGYTSYLVFDNFLILLIMLVFLVVLGLPLCRKFTHTLRNRQMKATPMTRLLRCPLYVHLSLSASW